jgi:CheY-like chemotaxis protein
LESHSAKVQAVQSVATAISSLNNATPDLIISDLGMPDRDGYDLIKYVRSLPAESGKNIPAIALTAYATANIEQQVLSAGFQKHLTKPTDFDQLLNAIVSLVPSPTNESYRSREERGFQVHSQT